MKCVEKTFAAKKLFEHCETILHYKGGTESEY